MTCTAAPGSRDGTTPVRRHVLPPEALAGARAIVPMVAGLVPLALAVGATASRARLPGGLGWVSSITLYGASGQLALLDGLDGGGSAVGAVLAALAANLQMLLFGAGMRAWWATERVAVRVTAASLLVSPLFAVASDHHRDEPDPVARRAYYLGAGLTLWAAWAVLTGVGYVAAGELPDHPAMGLLTPLAMVALAVRAVVDRPAAGAAIAGATVGVAVGAVAPAAAVTAGSIAGVVVGLATEHRAGAGREVSP